MDLKNTLCNPYADYMKLQLNNELRLVEGTVDEMLARLDEFENLLTMVRSNGVKGTDGAVAAMVTCVPAVDRLCSRVDQLEAIVDRVEADVNSVEAAVLQGEADLASITPVASITSFFKPLFAKHTVDAAVKKTHLSRPSIAVENLYNTDEFFPSGGSRETQEKQPAQNADQ